MALAVKRIPGNIATFAITGGGTIAAIRNLTVTATQGTFEATAATATFDQKTMGRKTAKGTYTLWLGTEGIAPLTGDTISVLSVSVGLDEVTPATIDDATVYGVMKVTSVEHTFQDSPATVTVSFEAGIIV